MLQKTSHLAVGGVTHTETHFVACLLQTAWAQLPLPMPSLPLHVPRDLSSVLSDVVGKGIPRTAPRQRQLTVGSSVVNVWPMAV